MPRIVPRTEQARALVEIAKHPAGIGVTELRSALTDKPARRTLQRWLAGLVRERRIVTEGAGRAMRYRLPPIQKISTTATPWAVPASTRRRRPARSHATF